MAWNSLNSFRAVRTNCVLPIFCIIKFRIYTNSIKKCRGQLLPGYIDMAPVDRPFHHYLFPLPNLLNKRRGRFLFKVTVCLRSQRMQFAGIFLVSCERMHTQRTSKKMGFARHNRISPEKVCLSEPDINFSIYTCAAPKSRRIRQQAFYK